jgi:uncharacterized damage-inducible protein DinB
MQETPQQYTQRILGNVAGQEPLKVQAATPKKLERFLAKASAAKLRKRPAPDKWSIGEILAHLADAEIVIAWRVRSILGAPGTAIQAFDQESWVVAGHYDKRNPSESVAQFGAVRDANLALYKSLTAEQWKQYGIHSERGQESVEHIVHMMAGHDLNHLKQIEAILAGK